MPLTAILAPCLIRFKKKRMEEELDIARKKLSRLRAQTEGSSMVEKLQEELKEYKDILKCSICVDKPKEVLFVSISLENDI